MHRNIVGIDRGLPAWCGLFVSKRKYLLPSGFLKCISWAPCVLQLDSISNSFSGKSSIVSIVFVQNLFWRDYSGLVLWSCRHHFRRFRASDISTVVDFIVHVLLLTSCCNCHCPPWLLEFSQITGEKVLRFAMARYFKNNMPDLSPGDCFTATMLSKVCNLWAVKL